MALTDNTRNLVQVLCRQNGQTGEKDDADGQHNRNPPNTIAQALVQMSETEEHRIVAICKFSTTICLQACLGLIQ